MLLLNPGLTSVTTQLQGAGILLSLELCNSVHAILSLSLDPTNYPTMLRMTRITIPLMLAIVIVSVNLFYCYCHAYHDTAKILTLDWYLCNLPIVLLLLSVFDILYSLIKSTYCTLVLAISLLVV